MNTWQAGAATSTFTVPPGTTLGGYADRTERSTGTSDSLEVSALVLQAGENTLHLMTADIVGVDRTLVDEISAAVGIDPDSLIVAASHTHSGPLGVSLRLHPAGADTVDSALRQAFVATAADAIACARTRLAPTTLTHGETTVVGTWSNRNQPMGPSDNRVRMLVVRALSDERLLAIVLLIPAHPTILGASNLLVSADLHSGIRRALRRLGNVEAPLLTMTGAAGDISTRFARRESSQEEVTRIGEMVARQVLDQLPTTPPMPATLTGTFRDLVLAPRELDDPETSAAHRSAEAEWEAIQRNPHSSEGDRRVAWTRLQGAEIQHRIANMPPLPVSLTAWRLGDALNLVTIPGELFSSLGRQIEDEVAAGNTWVIGYANGYAGYLADRAAIRDGTYEALASPWSADTSDEVVTTAIQAVNSLIDAGTGAA